MTRPNVDVVVPFQGTSEELQELVTNLGRIRVAAGDRIIIVDNGRTGRVRGPVGMDGVEVVEADRIRTPAFARNEGARRGTAPWLVFLDADTQPAENLLDRYFERAPGERTGLMAGGVLDQPVPRGGAAAARYAYLQDAMSQRQTFRLGEWEFAQMANAACRRAAFEAVGGFREELRAGEDADLCYRLRAGGWQIERRENARVVHRNRQTLRAFVAQKALHGAGAAWLDGVYPGSFPRRRRPGLLWWALRRSATGLLLATRHRDRDTALLAVFESLEQLSFEFGRSLPNTRRRGARLPRR